MATGTAACAMIGPASSSGTTKCTVQPDTRIPEKQHLLVHVHAFEQGQQRRMDVKQTPFPAAHEPIGQDAHETGETTISTPALVSAVSRARVEGFAGLIGLMGE